MLDISHSIPFDDETEDGKNHELKVLSLDRIKAATGSFSESNKLGEGGFGPVYMVRVILSWIFVLYLFFFVGQYYTVIGLMQVNTMNHFREHYLVEKK